MNKTPTRVQILKVNPLREGVGKTSNKPYRLQDAECVILNDDNAVEEVGVLMLPEELVGKVHPGMFDATFKLRSDKSREGGRRIGAVLVTLEPVRAPTSAAKS